MNDFFSVSCQSRWFHIVLWKTNSSYNLLKMKMLNLWVFDWFELEEVPNQQISSQSTKIHKQTKRRASMGERHQWYVQLMIFFFFTLLFCFSTKQIFAHYAFFLLQQSKANGATTAPVEASAALTSCNSTKFWNQPQVTVTHFNLCKPAM